MYRSTGPPAGGPILHGEQDVSPTRRFADTTVLRHGGTPTWRFADTALRRRGSLRQYYALRYCDLLSALSNAKDVWLKLTRLSCRARFVGECRPTLIYTPCALSVATCIAWWSAILETLGFEKLYSAQRASIFSLLISNPV